MTSIKNTVFFIITISSLIFANKADFIRKANYAKVIHSDIYSTTIDFQMDSFELVPTNIDNMFLARFKDGASILKEYAPDIHKYSRSIIVPDDAEMKIDILSSEFTEYDNINLAPSKGNFSRNINPESIPYVKGIEYNKNSFFPDKLVELQDPYILRGLRGQTIDFHPIQYNPITKVLRVYNKMVVKIYSNGNSNSNVLHRSSSTQNISHEYKNIYEDHFLNFNNDNRFDYLEDQGNMLIISYGTFMEEMQPFVDWKNRKGIPTEIVDVSEIGLNSTSIENFVDNYYYEKGLTFLLLVGDVAQIPSPTISGSASDPSYGFIEGNDSYAEVIVGRFSGSTPSQIATQVERSIEYERYPTNNADWYDNAMGVASNQGPGWGGLADDAFNDMLWNDILSDFTYDSYQYSYDGSGSVSHGMSIINNGVSIINYTGHGSISSWGNGAPLSTSNVNSLTNNDMLPFIISVACNNGEFNSTNECFGESWLRATNNAEPAGGVGFYGSTISMSWEPPMHGQYAMNLILTESYENHITRSMGGITTNGCLYMNDAQGSSGINETNYWTLFGDPSLELRTDQPTNLNVSHDDAIIVGQNELIINTGVDNALIAISKHNELLAYGYSENGSATINLENANLLPGEYDLVITSFNAFPYETILSVITPEGPYITFDSYTITSEGWMGIENGMAEFDETITLSLQANNVGVDAAYNVSAEISIDDMYISLGNNTVSFGDISAGGSANAGSIDFTIAHNVPDGHNAAFTVHFSSDEDEWEGSFNVPIHAPLLTVSNPSFIDEGGDGVWDAGETIQVTILLNNEGSSAHYSYPGVYLSENSENASIPDDLDFFWFYGIEAGTSVPATFIVTASENANMGTEVIFTSYADELNCEENCIGSESISFTFTIGLPFDTDLHEPLNLVAEVADNAINLSWDEPFQCPDGQFADCIGQCVDDWYEAWLGDGLCDDGTWGVYFNCEEFNNDGGDCGDVLTCEDQGLVTCPNGICESSLEDCPDTSCESGYIDDCSGDGDCCPESWIGDGFADCEDQAYGCDLTCYDNDGGDCFGRNNTEHNTKIGQMYPSRLNADFSNIIVLPPIESVEGYFVYREGAYIAFTNELNYSDSDINSGTEYCYHVTAVYEEGQSGASNTVCATSEGYSSGDLNSDNIINIQDIVIMVNMILGALDPNIDLADLNSDGLLNIQDIILLINMVLSPRAMHTYEEMGTDAYIYKDDSTISISANGEIAGIQMEISTSDIYINPDISLHVEHKRELNNHTLLIFGLDGETLSGDKIELFSTTSDYKIVSAIIVNSISNAMDLAYTNSNSTLKLDQNYPNPFNPYTQIQFTLSESQIVNLNIYDLQGRLVKSLINNTYMSIGEHKYTWDGKNDMGTQLPSGMYFCKLTNSNQIIVRKMVMMK